jgi:hypothetical protein
MPILVGTASWTDKSLIGCGRFYPKEASSAEPRLRYYAMPSASNAQRQQRPALGRAHINPSGRNESSCPGHQ